ncbi:MAG TPA: B-box zinc finger protein [Anaerolineae bacterium]|nr:B-box zinc finger protein [Anaerolineae bacterium]
MPESMFCVNHPDRQTLLRCGKCGRPICTQCAVRHPVGLRCPDCAQLRKVPTYDVPAPYYLRALSAGLGASLLTGVIAQLLPLFVPVFFLNFFMALAAGAFVGEAISRVTRRKRGRGLQVVAGISVIVGSVGATVLVAMFRFGALAFLLVPASLLNPYYWLYPVVAAAVAVMHLR